MSRLYDIEDVVDKEWMCLELPDDFMNDELASMYRNDPCLNVVNDPIMYQGQYVSPMRVFDYRDETIHVGMKEMLEPAFIPMEDFAAVDMVFNYADKFAQGFREIFPDLPLAPPIIPHNQYWRPEKAYNVEIFLASRGCVIVDPSFGFIADMDSFPIATVKDDTTLPSLESYPDDSIFFFPFQRVDFNEAKYIGKKIISMEFNPFHPMSMHFLHDFEWDDKEHIVRGHYKYKDILRKFTFMLTSGSYRIHSHVWLKVLREYRYDGMLENYDLCSNFDFAYLMGNDLIEREIFIEPLMIEPVVYKPRGYTFDKKNKRWVVTKQKIDKRKKIYKPVESSEEKDKVEVVPKGRVIAPLVGFRLDKNCLNVKFPYSLMTGNKVVSRGHTTVARCLYTTVKMHIEGPLIPFLDITKLSSLKEKSFVFNGTAYSLHGGDIDHSDIYIKIKDNDQYRAFLAIRSLRHGEGKSDKKKKPRDFEYNGLIFNSSKELDKKSMADLMSSKAVVLHFYESEVKYGAFPRSKKKGLFPSLKVLSLQEAKNLSLEELHVYMPMLTPYDGDLGAQEYGKRDYMLPLDDDEYDNSLSRQYRGINDLPIVEDYDDMMSDNIVQGKFL